MSELKDRLGLYWRRLKYKVKRVTKFPYQRVRYGFSDQDLYNFDKYLAQVLSQALPKLKDAHGYPADMETSEDWNEVLDKMTEGFARYHEEYEHPDTEEMRAWDKLLEEWFDREGVAPWPRLPESYREGSRKFDEEQERALNESLDLLKEYFRNLWD